MQSRFLAAAVLALTGTVSANAADALYNDPAPVLDAPAYEEFQWSGFYLGMQGGYNWNKVDFGSGKANANTGSIGAVGGYNFQSGNIVYGVENDFNYNFQNQGAVDLKWDASARGRLGYALDHTLFYGTGGMAIAGGEADITGGGTAKKMLIGWTAGAGVEHAFTDNILLRGEYRYSGFGKKDFGSGIGSIGANQHKVTFGVGYKF